VTRVLSGAALVVLAIAAVWFAPDAVFLGLAIVLAAAGAGELVTIAKARGIAVPRGAVELGAAVTVGAAASLASPVAFAAIVLSAFVALALLSLASWRAGSDALAVAAASIFPSIYVALPIALLVAIRSAAGPAALFLLMLTVMISDTAQYYTGRAFGKRPLAPAISPKKTIEGAIGGFVFGALTMAIAGAWWLPAMAPAVRVLVGVAIVALGIAGDLFESMLKRSAGIKDSSGLIPGHGGVLDRIDALLFAAPLYYIVLAASSQ